MTYKKSKATWGGAGESETWDAQEGPNPGEHWYNIYQAWIDGINDQYQPLPPLFVQAIRNPETKQEFGERWAIFDPDRKQVLVNSQYVCPIRFSHHLYQTCTCCGQYG